MKKVVLIVLIIATLISSACENKDDSKTETAIEPVPAEFAGKTNPLNAADAASAGAGVYETYCLSCHGEKGYGDGYASGSLDPAPKNLAELQPQVGSDYLFWRINSGKAG